MILSKEMLQNKIFLWIQGNIAALNSLITNLVERLYPETDRHLFPALFFSNMIDCDGLKGWAAPMAWTEPQFHQDLQPEPKLALLARTTFSSAVLILLLLTAFVGPCKAGPPQPARPPLLSGQPFIIFWGIPDFSCSGRPDLTSFGMEREGRVAIFHEDTLGNYPYFVDKNTPVNGGLPQHTRLDSHIQKTQQDLETSLPAPRYLGLGVVRWAEWFPQWSRNQEKQAMYQEASRNLMKSFFPNWNPEEVEKWSQVRRD